ncbi:hypothetical protein ES288_A09G001300v1 [Gossypium darwinii]|uniref:Peroxin-5 n=1 Tax=Gossypium darwinii TaxID=34276 RepID=A0A5D2F4M7_GOSDA|nr:hypothetical protein ES288_A09G001300v1 [Gossypium darwinii]
MLKQDGTLCSSHRVSNKCNVHVKLLDLRLQPDATQANSVQSSDAILAYQQALDLKPNYVRAWANMGISYANQVCYILHCSLIVLTFMKRELQLLYPSKYFILPMKIK